MPPFHRDYCQVDFFLPCKSVGVEICGQLARREPVDIRDGVLSDKRFTAFLHNVTFDTSASERVGAVEHDKFFAVASGGLHGESHCGNECVAAASDVLDVIDEHVDVAKHFGGGLACAAVQ